MISLEEDLLKRSDVYAKRHHLNRSQLISAGLRKLIAV
jgi:metal-responsive CopG/Arc/MetJ family transcriptional regulator